MRFRILTIENVDPQHCRNDIYTMERLVEGPPGLTNHVSALASSHGSAPPIRMKNQRDSDTAAVKIIDEFQQ